METTHFLRAVFALALACVAGCPVRPWWYQECQREQAGTRPEDMIGDMEHD